MFDLGSHWQRQGLQGRVRIGGYELQEFVKHGLRKPLQQVLNKPPRFKQWWASARILVKNSLIAE